MNLKSREECATTIFRARKRRECNSRKFLGRITTSTHLANEIKAVAVWHSEIADDDMRFVFWDQLNRLIGQFHLTDFSAFGRNQSLEYGSRIGVVLQNENPNPGQRDPLPRLGTLILQYRFRFDLNCRDRETPQ